MVAVALHVVDRHVGPVDGQLVEVGAAQPGELGVQVGEQAALQQRVVGDVDAGDQVADVEGDLLGLGEEVRGVAVEGEQADRLHRGQFLGDDVGRVEQVDALEHLVRGVREGLDAQFPLRVGARLDGVEEVAAVEVGVHAVDDLGLFPHQGVHAQLGLPVELDQGGLAGRVDQPEGVDAEALHHSVGARDAAVGHVPQGVVGGLGVQAHEVPEGVVRALRLRDLAVRVGLSGVDDVRELDGVLDEEDRNVVADQVEDALVRVELGGEAAGVAHRVGGAARAQDGGEPDEDLGLDVLGQEARLGDGRGGAVRLEDAVRAGPAGVHHALRDALVVELHDLLAQVVVLQEDRAAGPGLERVVGVVQPHALGGGQVGPALGDLGLVDAGDLSGRRHGGRTALVRLGRERLPGLGRLGDRRRLGTGLAGNAVLRAGGGGLAGDLVRSPLQGVALRHPVSVPSLSPVAGRRRRQDLRDLVTRSGGTKHEIAQNGFNVQPSAGARRGGEGDGRGAVRSSGVPCTPPARVPA